ncbi:hypothetical protein BDV39DRAFT_40913 [Aspergillus sergii]|uniref:Uncharacterized protein n=1 Tax=Aspergillus sergii TaxID=1034303 RepID=A0A5N6X9W8_9EURO|nr:hypothetical protein BDV39DRAFT_40913 [Aspergillus sergii]
MRYSKLMDGIHKSKHSTWRHMGKNTSLRHGVMCRPSIVLIILFSLSSIHNSTNFYEGSSLRSSSAIFDFSILQTTVHSFSHLNPLPNEGSSNTVLAPFQHLAVLNLGAVADPRPWNACQDLSSSARHSPSSDKQINQLFAIVSTHSKPPSTDTIPRYTSK